MKSELVPLELRPEGEFLGVPVTDFLDVKTSPCDVYFKTPTEKFIAIIRKGEEGVAEKAFRYSQKGLSYLYIDRASHEAQLQRIVDFGKLLYSRDDLPAGMRTAHLIRQIGRRLENLNSMNQVDQRLWAETSKDLASIHSLWNAGPWSDPESVLWNASVLDHSSTVLVISLMLGRQLGFSTEANFVRLGLAAAFHDIGLLGAPTSLVGRMSQEGFDEARSVADLGIVAEEFLISHAERGAEWVDQKLGADTLVTQAIQLHHWRQDDRLSPLVPNADGKAGPKSVPRIVEIIGIAEELGLTIKNDRFAYPQGWVSQFRQTCSDQFSFAVLDALPKAFEKPAVVRKI